MKTNSPCLIAVFFFYGNGEAGEITEPIDYYLGGFRGKEILWENKNYRADTNISRS